MLESKDYYIDLINSSKAYQFTSVYHYSGVGFKKAKINQGIYRKTDNRLVGVLQWGVSAQEGIRLDRYVKEPITKDEYLELNRFCMADSEGKNAESQAISLGIKWIKCNRPDIRLLVSYAGRKEGNYGYIYQATNWEYLGYFISSGFWLVDGVERHQITLWNRYQRHGDKSKGFTEGICDLFHDVRQTWTKQFIYIQRLDKALTCASDVLPYPKPANEYPICTKVKVHKEEPYELAVVKKVETPIYYEKETELFHRRTAVRNGNIVVNYIAVYNHDGELEKTCKTKSEAASYAEASAPTIKKALDTGKIAKDMFFRYFPSTAEPPEHIDDYEYLCEIDGSRFFSKTEVAEYCGVSHQAVSGAHQRGANEINGYKVLWKK